MKRRGMLACLLGLLLLIPAGEGLRAQSGGGPSGWDAFNNLDVGGELRIRPEYRSPFGYSGAPDSDDQALMRTRLHIGFDVSDHVAAMLEFQDSRAFGEEPLTVNSNANELDLHQGYVRFHKLQDTRYMRYMPEGSDAWIVFGRERLPQFGEGRMISTLEWDNVGRRYDGGRFGYAYRDDHQIDVLFANLGENALGASPGGSTVDDKLYGFNFNSSALPAVDVDLYFWWREFDRTTRFDDRTYGVRLEGDFDEMEMEMLEGAYASFELAFQNGDRGLGPTLDVSAIGWALDLGYELSDTRFSPGIGVGYTFASGDENSADTDAETFIPVAPYGHEFQGYYDLFSWQNNHDTYIKAWAAPWKTLRLHADFHLFRLDEEQDAWYNAAGSVVQQDAGGTSGKQLGTELDLHAKWTCGDSLSFWTGWSHFWPGRFVNNTSGRSQGDFLFFQMELLFGSS